MRRPFLPFLLFIPCLLTTAFFQPGSPGCACGEEPITITIIGPSERGLSSLPAGEGSMTIDIYAQGPGQIAGMTFSLRFTDQYDSTSDLFFISMFPDTGDPDDPNSYFGFQKIFFLHSFPPSVFPIYDGNPGSPAYRSQAGFMLMSGYQTFGNYTAILRLVYDCPHDAIGPYTIDLHTLPQYNTIITPPEGGELPFTCVPGHVTFYHNATTWYVDDDAANDPGPGDPTLSDPAENGSVNHPFDSLQEAVTASFNTDTIIVRDGTYSGHGNRDIDFLGRKVTLRSEHGPGKTVIDCGGSAGAPHRAFLFTHGETTTSAVQGFTIKNGYVSGAGAAGQGGAIYCKNASPIIASCIIHNCTATSGGAIYCDASSPSIISTTISTCTATPPNGGGIGCTGTPSSPALASSIVWGNTPGGLSGGTPAAIYCDIDSTTVMPGIGNIKADPLFANPAGGDFHLKSEYGRWNPATTSWVLDPAPYTSPCLDTGEPSMDYDEEPVPNGFRINMGAYGNTAEASKSPRSLSVQSTPSGVAITGDKPGTAPYTAGCADGQVVNLFAPPAPTVVGKRYDFQRWTIDGFPQTDLVNTVQVTMSADHTIVAQYAIQRHTLYVNSSPTGVGITGGRPGTTNYSVVCNDMDQFTLTAPTPVTIGGKCYNFRHWVLDTVTQLESVTQLSLTMDANHTAEAVYAIQKYPLSVQSDPISAVHITGDLEGDTNFTTNIDDQTVVNLTAPAQVVVSTVHYDFVRWSIDSVPQTDGVLNVQVTMSTNHIVIACYEIHKYTLSIESIPSGVGITGDYIGTTPYSAKCTDLSMVTLTAQQAVVVNERHYNFVRWRIDAADQTPGVLSVLIRMDADRTATAVYAIQTWALNVQSTPSSGVSITGDKPGTTPYAATCDDRQSITLTAPVQVGNLFYRGWTDALGSPVTFPLVVAGDTTLTVTYAQITDFYVSDAAGNDDFSGTLPEQPMKTIQAILNKYPNMAAGCTLHVGAGTYYENVVIGSTHSGLIVDGGSAATTTIDGRNLGPCIALNSFSTGTIRNFTLTNGNGDTGTELYGGGIKCGTSSSPLITGNRIIANHANNGGGIHCFSGTAPQIVGNVIGGNTASGRGGGINLSGTAAGTVVANNVIYGNSAVDGGGGIYCYSTSLTMRNNTVAGNNSTTYGGGIYCYWATPTIYSFIIWGNTGGYGSQLALGLRSSRPSTLRVWYSDVQGGQAGVLVDSGSTLYWNTGNLNTDPFFADPAGHDYHLKSTAGRWDPAAGAFVTTDLLTSPCIDAGDPAAAWANEPAPNGSRINMGAYGNTAQASKTARSLTVQSTPVQGFVITGTRGGTTDYTVECNNGESVTLTAPANAAIGGARYNFQRWTLDGAPQTLYQANLGVTMTTSHVAVAVYEIQKHNLAVQSTPAGITISGPKGGTTNYVAACDENQAVLLTAPATATVADVEYSFVRWLLDKPSAWTMPLAPSGRSRGSTRSAPPSSAPPAPTSMSRDMWPTSAASPTSTPAHGTSPRNAGTTRRSRSTPASSPSRPCQTSTRSKTSSGRSSRSISGTPRC